jgi:hypothetical protein
MSETFKVGDMVSIVQTGCYGGIIKTELVSSIGKMKITLADGSVWKVRNGRKWGSDTGRSFSWAYIRPFEPRDGEAIRRGTALRTIDSISRWDAFSTNDLVTIAAIIRNRKEPA